MSASTSVCFGRMPRVRQYAVSGEVRPPDFRAGSVAMIPGDLKTRVLDVGGVGGRPCKGATAISEVCR